jgi:hypothetical protein
MHIFRYIQRLAPHIVLNLHYSKRSLITGKKNPHATCFAEAIVNGQMVDAIGERFPVESKAALQSEFTPEHLEAIRTALVNLRWEVIRVKEDELILGEIERVLMALENPKRLAADAMEAMEEPPTDFDPLS